MIDIKKLNKSYKSISETLDIYRELNLQVSDWEFISIVWPSWWWKTTLLNLVAWLDSFDSGEMIVNKNNLSSLSNDQKTLYRAQNISFIFQQFNLIDNLTVKENIDLVIELNWLERRYETSEILKIVWLEGKTNSYPFNLSWWEQQRVAVARAFVWKTPILLADEPTWNLDSKNSEIIINLIKKLHKDSWNTILMITHDLEISKIADRVYTLKNFSLV